MEPTKIAAGIEAEPLACPTESGRPDGPARRSAMVIYGNSGEAFVAGPERHAAAEILGAVEAVVGEMGGLADKAKDVLMTAVERRRLNEEYVAFRGRVDVLTGDGADRETDRFLQDLLGSDGLSADGLRIPPSIETCSRAATAADRLDIVARALRTARTLLGETASIGR